MKCPICGVEVETTIWRPHREASQPALPDRSSTPLKRDNPSPKVTLHIHLQAQDFPSSPTPASIFLVQQAPMRECLLQASVSSKAIWITVPIQGRQRLVLWSL